MVTSGHGFDGGPGRDFADFLRRELHAAADQVQPGADGLERIRDKIRSRPASASRPTGALGVWLAISGFLAGLGRRLASVLGVDHPSGKHGGTAGEGDARREPKWPTDWREAMLRPAFAVGLAVFAVGVVLAVFLFNRPATAEIYTLSLHAALPP